MHFLRLDRLQMRGFRNIKEILYCPSPHLNVFVGNNGQGKTNLLEGVYFLATASSQRAYKEDELINWQGDEAYLEGEVAYSQTSTKICVVLTRGKRKQIWVGSKRLASALDVFGRLSAVLFSPDDLNLVKGSPSARRRYLDLQIALANKYFRHQLQKYNKVLAQRNLALKKGHFDQMDIWDEQLVTVGVDIMERRMEAVDMISEFASVAHRSISGTEDLRVIYLPFFLREQREYMIARAEKGAPYSKDKLRGIFTHQLEEKKSLERIQKMTLVGPQRDDLIFLINSKDARIYGSQGQQRTAVLASKLAELNYVAQAQEERPLLLLDDVLSELDQNRCERFLMHISQDTQIFLTTTDLGSLDKRSLAGAQISHISEGRLEQVEKF